MRGQGLFLVVGLLLWPFGCGTTAIPAISPSFFAEYRTHDSHYILLDVRTPEEWSDTTGHLEGAVLLPVGELETDQAKVRAFLGKRVVVYCRSGGRAGRATRILRAEGVEAYNLEGGIRAWRTEGRPVVVEEGKNDR